ncbi:uncharacterized protein LOC135146331 [Zophobas morio]|uniref:uncharacterized protein LOC135146331 n=1 Tax=Zophobas morio TaxID=2755281 RepID=UPI003082EDF3
MEDNVAKSLERLSLNATKTGEGKTEARDLKKVSEGRNETSEADCAFLSDSSRLFQLIKVHKQRIKEKQEQKNLREVELAKIKVSEDHVNLIAREFELNNSQASYQLKLQGGDLFKTMKALLTD